MSYFKDNTNAVHFIDDDSLAYLLPIGAEKISDSEAEEIKLEQSQKVIVPNSVTMRQARLALLAAGKLSQVDAAINSLPEPQRSEAKIEWEYSGEVLRNKPFVQSLGAALGLSNDDLDALFIEAVKL